MFQDVPECSIRMFLVLSTTSQIHPLQMHVLQVHVLKIHVSQIHVLQIHVLQHEETFRGHRSA